MPTADQKTPGRLVYATRYVGGGPREAFRLEPVESGKLSVEAFAVRWMADRATGWPVGTLRRFERDEVTTALRGNSATIRKVRTVYWRAVPTEESPARPARTFDSRAAALRYLHGLRFEPRAEVTHADR